MSKIVLEDLNEGNGYYKVNLTYLNKEQVEEIEALFSTWNPTDEEDIKSCIGMCLTDANEQRFRDYGTNLKECLAWLEKQSKQETVIGKLNDANVRKEFKWDSENKIMIIYGVTYEEMKALDDFIYCLRSGTKCPKGEEEPQTVTFIDSGTMQVVDKLNEIIGKLGDIHEVLSKSYVFPYRDYIPPQMPTPNPIPGMDVWYKTHGVEKVAPVTCETLSDTKGEKSPFNSEEEDNEE